jgi:hypothetical protein
MLSPSTPHEGQYRGSDDQRRHEAHDKSKRAKLSFAGRPVNVWGLCRALVPLEIGGSPSAAHATLLHLPCSTLPNSTRRGCEGLHTDVRRATSPSQRRRCASGSPAGRGTGPGAMHNLFLLSFRSIWPLRLRSGPKRYRAAISLRRKRKAGAYLVTGRDVFRRTRDSMAAAANSSDEEGRWPCQTAKRSLWSTSFLRRGPL